MSFADMTYRLLHCHACGKEKNTAELVSFGSLPFPIVIPLCHQCFSFWEKEGRITWRTNNQRSDFTLQPDKQSEIIGSCIVRMISNLTPLQRDHVLTILDNTVWSDVMEESTK